MNVSSGRGIVVLATVRAANSGAEGGYRLSAKRLIQERALIALMRNATQIAASGHTIATASCAP